MFPCQKLIQLMSCIKKVVLTLSYSKNTMSIVTAYVSKPFRGTYLSVYILDTWEKNHCMFWSLIQSQCFTLNSYLGDISSVTVLPFSGFLFCWNTATYKAWNMNFSTLAQYFSGRRLEKHCIHTKPGGKCRHHYTQYFQLAGICPGP